MKSNQLAAVNASSWFWQGVHKAKQRLGNLLQNVEPLNWDTICKRKRGQATEIFRLYFTGVDKSTVNKIAANDTHSQSVICSESVWTITYRKEYIETYMFGKVDFLFELVIVPSISEDIGNK